MSNDKSSTSGDKSGTSGSDNSEDNGTYSKDFVEKLRKEKENTAKSLSDLKKQNEKLMSDLESLQNQELQKQNKYKELYENEQKKASELLAKLNKQTETITTSKKREAVSKELFKFGLDEKFLDDALRLADLNGVQVDSETLAIIGAEDVAKGFFEKYKTVGFFKPKTTSANHNGIARGGVNSLSGLDLSKMTQEQKMQKLREIHSKK